MRKFIHIALAGFELISAACAGPGAYHAIDVHRDLSKETLQRYEEEWQARRAHAPGHGMAELERTNPWPLGLLLYWQRGGVKGTSRGAEGPSYGVASAQGFGPLSAVYVSDTHSTFDGKGRRLSTMSMTSVLFGHLAMFHESDILLPSGQRQRMSSAHLMHHAINIHRMNGHTSLSRFSAPNPVGIDMHSGHGHH